MTNHVHILATPSTDDGVSLMMQALGRRYVRYFNYTYQRTGTLWEGRFKSCIVQANDYLLRCYRYIELNPVRASMVSDPSGYSWSSYRCNALGVKSELCKPHEIYLSLGLDEEERQSTYRELFNAHLDECAISEIANSSNSGLALGSDMFKSQIEELYGRRVTVGKRGRPAKL
jgi:putative transposase